MIKAKSRIIINQRVLKQITADAMDALEKTAEALKTDVIQAQVIPFDTGNLQGESFFVDYSKSAQGEVALVHSTPYARRLYFHPEYNFQTTENPNARGEWYEDWLEGGDRANFAPKTFAEFMKKEGGR